MTRTLTSTVVMTTYNGEMFISEQLKSLLNQTRIIDEVLIFDDGSKDNTISIIESFIKKNDLCNWNLEINKKNKGWKKNFFEGIKKATGDVIFPCDQDDIWLSDKIEAMMACFESNDNIDVLVGKYEKYFMNANTKLKLDWQKIGLAIDHLENIIYKSKSKKEILEKRKFNESFLQLEPGCCFAIKKDFANEIESYWFAELGHDAFYTFFSELKGTYYNLNKVVIKWRHYEGSTSRPKSRTKQIRLDEIERNEKVIVMMIDYVKNSNIITDKEQKLKYLNRAYKWNFTRRGFITDRGIVKGLKLLRYFKYYERYRAVVTDWVYAYMKGKVC